MLKKYIENINKKIIDVRMKKRINENVENIIKNNGKIYPNIIIKNKEKKLKIKTYKNYIKYIYENKTYKEEYKILKHKKEYISEYKNNELKQISVFKNEKEMIKHIEEENKETTYIRTNKNNIILIEKTENKKNYYIGINENKYENYIPNNAIYTEITEEDYNEIISKKEEDKILEKYCITEKKLHLQ